MNINGLLISKKLLEYSQAYKDMLEFSSSNVDKSSYINVNDNEQSSSIDDSYHAYDVFKMKYICKDVTQETINKLETEISLSSTPDEYSKGHWLEEDYDYDDSEYHTEPMLKFAIAFDMPKIISSILNMNGQLFLKYITRLDCLLACLNNCNGHSYHILQKMIHSKTPEVILMAHFHINKFPLLDQSKLVLNVIYKKTTILIDIGEYEFTIKKTLLKNGHIFDVKQYNEMSQMSAFSTHWAWIFYQTVGEKLIKIYDGAYINFGNLHHMFIFDECCMHQHVQLDIEYPVVVKAEKNYYEHIIN